ncbi:MAG: amidohydrolase family protein, partial [Methylocella sp.]
MTRVIKGQTVSFDGPQDVRHETNGAIVVGDDGTILWTGPLPLLPHAFRMAPSDDYGGKLVMPGFIDAHIHFPQYRMLAAPGKDLIDWLKRFAFPEESRYGDAAHAAAAAEIFLDRLAEHGTTAALAFCSVHKACADALFAAAKHRNMALI